VLFSYLEFQTMEEVHKRRDFEVGFYVLGNDGNKSKFDSGGNQEETEFW
jgi:hypothetical protein